MLDQASSRAAADGGQQDWTNPFAFFFSEDASLADAHRIAYTAFLHVPADGAELAYACDDLACVNPGHAREILLPGESRWMCGIIEKVTCRPARLELHISMPADGARRVFVDHAMLDQYGFGDASSLAERVVFFTPPDDQGWVQLLPVQRRVDHARQTLPRGTDRQKCLTIPRSSIYFDGMAGDLPEGRRLMDAAASTDPETGLTAVVALRQLVEVLEELQVDRARQQGWSWRDIAMRLGVTKQAVHYKHGLRVRRGRGEP
jgi:hypothetical protein